MESGPTRCSTRVSRKPASFIEEAAGAELDAGREPVGGGVVLEDWAYLGEIEADSGDVGIGERDLNDEVALRGADVHGGFVLLPGKLLRDGQVGTAADAGHGFEEGAEPFRVGIQILEEAGLAVAGFVLRLTTTKGDGEVVPERIEALIRHLQDATDVGRLSLIEEEIGCGRVAVRAVLTFEEVESNESVEKVARRARVQGEPGAEFG
jgi:hypothetical protein